MAKPATCTESSPLEPVADAMPSAMPPATSEKATGITQGGSGVQSVRKRRPSSPISSMRAKP